ncbi:MAG: phosphoadenylyl-sulfate reductase [Turneriella sp.]
MTNLATLLTALEKIAPQATLQDTIRQLTSDFSDLQIVFSSSLSLEDQAITHIIAENKLPVRIFTLDTGRHFPETYRTLEATRERYGISPEVYFPDFASVERLMNEKGAFSFYKSIEDRQECCRIRKVEPLKRALRGAHLWITGIRRAHSAERGHLPQAELDEANKVVKYHPLLEWDDSRLRAFIDEHNIPYNRLQDKGFLSIGCEPCTRAVKPGESMRSGRWWWEDPDKKECGLHVPAPVTAQGSSH